jgi:hypothetical protein
MFQNNLTISLESLGMNFELPLETFKDKIKKLGSPLPIKYRTF